MRPTRFSWKSIIMTQQAQTVDTRSLSTELSLSKSQARLSSTIRILLNTKKKKNSTAEQINGFKWPSFQLKSLSHRTTKRVLLASGERKGWGREKGKTKQKKKKINETLVTLFNGVQPTKNSMAALHCWESKSGRALLWDG